MLDFKNKNLSGQIKVDEGNWVANINNGNIFPVSDNYKFISSDISKGEESSVDNISGNIEGGFYGNEANAVGGSFHLEGSSGSVEGVFGGKKSKD